MTPVEALVARFVGTISAAGLVLSIVAIHAPENPPLGIQLSRTDLPSKVHWLYFGLAWSVLLMLTPGLLRAWDDQNNSLLARAKAIRRDVRIKAAGETWATLIRRMSGRKVLIVHRPSVRTALLVTTGIGLATWLFPRLLRWHPAPTTNGLWDDAWAAYMVLATATLPILLFVIEMAKGERTVASPTSEVLVEASGLFPIFVGLIGLSIVFTIPGLPDAVAAVLVFAALLLVVAAYSRTIYLLTDMQAARRAELARMRRHVLLTIESEIDGRLADRLLRVFGDEQNVEVGRFALPRDWAVKLSLPVEGVVADIDLQGLRQFFGSLEAPLQGATDASLTPESSAPPFRPHSFLVGLGSTVESGRPVASVQGVGGKNISALEERLANAIRLEPLEPFPSGANQLDADLQRIRAAAVRAVRARDVADLRTVFDVYLYLLRTFLVELRAYGLQHDRDTVRDGGFFAFNDWRLIGLLREHAVDILAESFENPRPGILSRVLYFPYSLAGVSLREGDFLPFAGFVPHYFLEAYRLAGDADGRIREVVVSQLARDPQSYATIYLDDKLGGKVGADEVEAVFDQMERLLALLFRLSKAAFDMRAKQDFMRFQEAFRAFPSESFSVRVDGFRDWNESRLLEIETDLDAAQESLFAAIRRRLDALEEMRRVGALGLRTLFAMRASSGELDAEELAEWFELVDWPGDLKSKSEDFLVAWTGNRYVDEFGWSFWEHEGREVWPPIAVRSVFDVFLRQAFLGTLLVDLGSRGGSVNRGDFPVDPEFEALVREEGALRQTLSALVEDDNWGHLLPQKAAALARNLEAALDAYLLDRRTHFEQRVRDASISQQEVAKMSAAIVDGFGRAAGLVELLRENDAVSVVWREDDEPPLPWGYNQLKDKKFFVEFNTVTVYGWDSWGNSLARLVEKRVWEALRGGLEHCHPSPSRSASDVVSFLAEETKRLQGSGLEPSILLSRAWRIYHLLLRDHAHFTPAPDRGSSFLGHFHGAPVFRLVGTEDAAVVADLGKLGQLRFAKNDDWSGEWLCDVIRFKVAPVDYETAKGIVEDNPSWLRPDGGGERTEEEAVDRVLRTVIAMADIRAEYEILDADKGVFVPMDVAERG